VTVEFITLRQLAGVLKLAIAQGTTECWVVAEAASVNLNRASGHCYLELIEKDGDATLAQMKATIWSRVYRGLDARFRAGAGRPIEKGMKLLLLVRPVFHEVYGLSLSVTDIDPRYTLGEMALRRRETIDRLRKEGLLDRNRRLPLPPVVLRLAVVTSRTAAGLGDFRDRLRASPYAFTLDLHEAVMQGEKAEASIMEALGRVARKAARYDAVVVVRGGGAQADLQCFDSYALCRAAALMPLPVLTGVGHERDESVMDMVAHRRLITPTACAEFLVGRARDFEGAMEALGARIATLVHKRMSSEREALALARRGLRAGSHRMIEGEGARMGRLGSEFGHLVRRALVRASQTVADRARGIERHVLASLGRRGQAVERVRGVLPYGVRAALAAGGRRLERAETRVTLLDPVAVMRRGYSITLHAGRALRDASGLRVGEHIETRLMRGSITSSIEGTTPGEAANGE
jgi:exodeoxyribonuclease VII large subunit